MRLLAMFLIVIGMSISIFADEINPEKQAEIEKLLTNTKVLESSSKIIDIIGQQMLKDAQTKGVKLTPYLMLGILEDIKSVYAEKFPEYKKMIIVMYSKHFELEELKVINQFYETPTGRKFIEKMPALAIDALKLSSQWTALLKPDLEKKIKARLEAGSNTTVKNI
jgi:hypothetical protein